MQVILKNINEIIPYENNPRNNEEAVDFVANSIKEFGFKQPILTDRDLVIITGHTRLLAAQQLGLAKVPVIIDNELSEEQVRAYRLADNRTNEFAHWNFSMLNEELDSLKDFDMGDFGFAIEDLTDIDDDFLSEFLVDEEDEGQKLSLNWAGKRVPLTQEEVDTLDGIHADWKKLKDDSSFVDFLIGNNHD